jgi:hypothetical protein
VQETTHLKSSITRKMKKRILFTLTLVATFALGFAFKSFITEITDDQPPLKKATGIGGIFFKCKDPKKVREWYKTHIGLNTNQYGAVFEWRQGADTTKRDSPSGARLPKKRNTLNHLRKNL